MYDFFYDEFENLKALTGFNQWEKIQESGKEEINKIIDLMIDETKREPFKILKPIVLQRVIHDAILNDGEFTGLNAKFVRKALNAWWGIYGQKILEARDAKGPEFYQPVKLDAEADARVNTLLQSFYRSIQNGVFQQVPDIKPEEVRKQGAEWKSELERKAVSKGYSKTSEQKIIDHELHIQYIRDNYDPHTAKPKPGWVSEDQWRKNLHELSQAGDIPEQKGSHVNEEDRAD